jgi:phage baseplate assembly protein V
MEGFLNMMRREASRERSETANIRIGVVDGFNPATHAVRVRLQPEDQLTGWLPMAAAQAGGGWGVFAPPSIGDQVVLAIHDGDLDAPICVGVLPDDGRRPPGAASGEIWLMHASGSKVRLMADGTAEIAATTIKMVGNVTLTGNFTQVGAFAQTGGGITTAGNISAPTGTVAGLAVTINGADYAGHRHNETGVVTGTPI